MNSRKISATRKDYSLFIISIHFKQTLRRVSFPKTGNQERKKETELTLNFVTNPRPKRGYNVKVYCGKMWQHPLQSFFCILHILIFTPATGAQKPQGQNVTKT